MNAKEPARPAAASRTSRSAAAQLWTLHPEWTADEVRAVLLSTVQAVGGSRVLDPQHHENGLSLPERNNVGRNKKFLPLF